LPEYKRFIIPFKGIVELRDIGAISIKPIDEGVGDDEIYM
jgi:hypothetical protein